jgi:hypothetical protein
MEVTSL